MIDPPPNGLQSDYVACLRPLNPPVYHLPAKGTVTLGRGDQAELAPALFEAGELSDATGQTLVAYNPEKLGFSREAAQLSPQPGGLQVRVGANTTLWRMDAYGNNVMPINGDEASKGILLRPGEYLLSGPYLWRYEK